MLAAAAEAAYPAQHAIEVRVSAEDPVESFAPVPGRIGRWRPPAGRGIRMDDWVEDGSRIGGDYDPLLGKLLVVDADRERAIDRMADALDRLEVTGIQTTLPFDRWLMADPAFRAGDLSTDFVERHWLPGPGATSRRRWRPGRIARPRRGWQHAAARERRRWRLARCRPGASASGMPRSEAPTPTVAGSERGGWRPDVARRSTGGRDERRPARDAGHLSRDRGRRRAAGLRAGIGRAAGTGRPAGRRHGRARLRSGGPHGRMWSRSQRRSGHAGAALASYEVVVDGWRFVVDVEPAARAELRERGSRTGERGRSGGRQVVRAQIPGAS